MMRSMSEMARSVFTLFTELTHCVICIYVKFKQSNLDSSNTDGSFTIANSNSFLSSYEVLPIAQEKKYLEKFSYFIVKLYVECTH